MRKEFAALRAAVEARTVVVTKGAQFGTYEIEASYPSADVRAGIKALGGRWNGSIYVVGSKEARDPVAAGELAVLEVITKRAYFER